MRAATWKKIGNTKRKKCHVDSAFIEQVCETEGFLRLRNLSADTVSLRQTGSVVATRLESDTTLNDYHVNEKQRAVKNRNKMQS
jgi:hypothetical protein